LILGERYKEIIILNIIKSAFKSSILFKDLNTDLLEGVFEYFTMKNFMKNDFVVGSDHVMGSKILVVLEGGISTVFFFLKSLIERVFLKEVIFYLKKKFYFHLKKSKNPLILD
jgi:hypothetical protein